MNRFKENGPLEKKDETIIFPLNKASRASLERLKDRVSEEELDGTPDSNDLTSLENDLEHKDPNFQSELDYEGYQTIEESDNNAYNSLDPERNMDTETELTIKDREEDQSMGEENLVDPQENKRG